LKIREGECVEGKQHPIRKKLPHLGFPLRQTIIKKKQLRGEGKERKNKKKGHEKDGGLRGKMTPTIRRIDSIEKKWGFQTQKGNIHGDKKKGRVG